MRPLDREEIFRYGPVAAAAKSDAAITEIGLHATATMPKGPKVASDVHIEITIDPSHLVFTRDNAGQNVHEVDLAAFCVDGHDSIVGSFWNTIRLTFTDDRLNVVTRDGAPVTLTVPVDAPANNVKIIAYDYGSDLLGSVVAKVQ